MPRVVTPVVLLPRFTSIVGAGPVYRTLPIDVSSFEKAVLTLWRGPIIGTSATMQVGFLESTDRVNWTPATPEAVPPPDVEMQVEFSLTKRWLQTYVALQGGNAGVTCWVQGYFLNRGP